MINNLLVNPLHIFLVVIKFGDLHRKMKAFVQLIASSHFSEIYFGSIFYEAVLLTSQGIYGPPPHFVG